jgi:hypothetical protein
MDKRSGVLLTCSVLCMIGEKWRIHIIQVLLYYIGQIEDSKMNRSRCYYTHMREELIDGMFIHSRNFGYNIGTLKSPVVTF